MSRAASARHESVAKPAPRELPRGYLKQSQLPLAALVFLLPFIVLYELGTRHFAFDPSQNVEQRISAFIWMHQFFRFSARTGKYMPPLAVIGILLSAAHRAKRSVEIRPGTLFGMAIEGAAWAMPLVAIGTLSARYLTTISR